MRHCTTVALAFAGMAAFGSLAHAADLPSPNNTVPQPDTSGPDWIAQWFQRVDAAQASQPHWMTPLVTVTPRLEEEVRYDQSWQTLQNGGSLDNYGGGKGLELIPTTTNEVIIGVPPYEDRQSAKPASGFADWPAILIKQRLLSANESHGNYILTAFLAASAPTGVAAFTNNAWLITPTIAGGVGFGDFDVQATFGAALPTAYESTLGTAFATNVALQYHFATYFWPELEFNDTYWDGGLRSGKNQLFITPGVVLGRFQLPGRAKLSVGVGYQVALGPVVQNTPVMTPTYNHEWLMSARVSF
ncbi:MAG TPA: hypothetical protein VGH40_06280 [Roseiarcus sp.]